MITNSYSKNVPNSPINSGVWLDWAELSRSSQLSAFWFLWSARKSHNTNLIQISSRKFRHRKWDVWKEFPKSYPRNCSTPSLVWVTVMKSSSQIQIFRQHHVVLKVKYNSRVLGKNKGIPKKSKKSIVVWRDKSIT